MPKLTVIISTYGSRISLLKEVIQEYAPDIEYLIIHQKYVDVKYLDFLHRTDVKIIKSKTIGLAKSRNVGISKCTTPYALIADDDVKYYKNSFRDILALFEDQPEIGVALFKIKTLDGEPPYKDYPLNAYRLNDGVKHWASSIEIAFKVQAVKDMNIQFDERFGIGNKTLVGGEEYIFVHDCMKSGLIVQYFPQYTVIHPYESSTKKMAASSPKRLITEGAVEARVLGAGALIRTGRRFVARLVKFQFNKYPFRSFCLNLMGNILILRHKK